MLSRIIIEGTIQGIGFRPFVYRIAVKNNISGFIRNNEDGTIEIVAEGTKKDTDIFLYELYNNKPFLAHYHHVQVDKLNNKDSNYHYQDNKFIIFPSSTKRKYSFSMIPPDISICNKCLADIYNENNKRRFQYPFTSCTQCGPRYTILKSTPYDRNRLSISKFPLCDECALEYNSLNDRRFHSETICCNKCGPRYFLLDKKGSNINSTKSLSIISKLISEGSIIAVKGIGGFHLITSAFNYESISKLRLIKNRKNKPFAVMAKDIDTVKSFANLNSHEEKLLKSYIKPIVLLSKEKNYSLSSLVAPNLHSIGVMLPYSGLHNLLLDNNNNNNSIMVVTSANSKNQPIIIDNSEAVKTLCNSVDYFLLHNLDIISRSEDSVVKYVYDKILVLRRSRGYVPNPIYLNKKSKTCILALGSELNLTFSIIIDNKCYISNYIGDIVNLENYKYLQKSINHFFHFLDQIPQIIVCDLHPSFNTTRLGYHMKNSENILIQQQHHYAHILSLMAEYSIDEIIGIVCDGAGYGDDGSIWGGEILTSNRYGYERSGHLMEQPMIGGDKATYYPLRMVAGILYNEVDQFENFIYEKFRYFHGGSKEVKILFDEIIKINSRKFKTVMTTSTGRILDAVSSLLGICYERTYEGEPALKLESAALNGSDVLNQPPLISNNILNTTFLLQNIYENRKRFSTKDLAYSAHLYIAKGLAEIAIDKALTCGIKKIGFSGGVAYNSIITKTLAEIIRKAGIKFITHEHTSPGDSGISIGQAYSALFIE